MQLGKIIELRKGTLKVATWRQSRAEVMQKIEALLLRREIAPLQGRCVFIEFETEIEASAFQKLVNAVRPRRKRRPPKGETPRRRRGSVMTTLPGGIAPEKIAEWKRLAEAATPGPWEARLGIKWAWVDSATTWIADCMPPRDSLVKAEGRDANAAFIAAAREAVTALLAEREAVPATSDLAVNLSTPGSDVAALVEQARTCAAEPWKHDGGVWPDIMNRLANALSHFPAKADAADLFERVPYDVLVKAFGVTRNGVKEAMNFTGFLYRQLASPLPAKADAAPDGEVAAEREASLKPEKESGK